MESTPLWPLHEEDSIPLLAPAVPNLIVLVGHLLQWLTNPDIATHLQPSEHSCFFEITPLSVTSSFYGDRLTCLYRGINLVLTEAYPFIGEHVPNPQLWQQITAQLPLALHYQLLELVPGHPTAINLLKDHWITITTAIYFSSVVIQDYPSESLPAKTCYRFLSLVNQGNIPLGFVSVNEFLVLTL